MDRSEHERALHELIRICSNLTQYSSKKILKDPMDPFNQY